MDGENADWHCCRWHAWLACTRYMALSIEETPLIAVYLVCSFRFLADNITSPQFQTTLFMLKAEGRLTMILKPLMLFDHLIHVFNSRYASNAVQFD